MFSTQNRTYLREYLKRKKIWNQELIKIIYSLKTILMRAKKIIWIKSHEMKLLALKIVHVDAW